MGLLAALLFRHVIIPAAIIGTPAKGPMKPRWTAWELIRETAGLLRDIVR